MRRLLVIALVVLVGACSTHGVRCDGRLQPINAPAPAVHEAPVVQDAPNPASGAARGGAR